MDDLWYDYSASLHFTKQFGLNILYSLKEKIKDRAEQKAMFSPLHEAVQAFSCTSVWKNT